MQSVINPSGLKRPKCFIFGPYSSIETIMRILASPAFSNERVNPYNSQLYRKIESIGHSVFEYSHKRALLEKFDVVHVHWPDGYIDQPNWVKAIQRAALLVLMMLVAKAKGARLVWTAHNLKPHD